jgi:uncharacterized protein (TIGR03437 family)
MMRALVLLAIAGTLAFAQPLTYSAASIVNSADNLPGALAPNTIATVYGANLAFTTKSISPEDIHGGSLPTVLPGTGVRVLIGGLAAQIYYVSPTQINFLVPSTLLPLPTDAQVVRDGVAGPLIPIPLARAAPALYQMDTENAVATRPDGSLITADAPARPGEEIVLYATGLGPTIPPMAYGEVATAAAWIGRLTDFQISFEGVLVDPGRIDYVGVTPGFAGLYQINVRLPNFFTANPEIRIGFADRSSRPGLKVPAQP